MDEFYSPGHLATIYPFMEGLPEPEWLLLGGPADANEAQTVRERWPNIKVIGVDPNPDVIAWQLLHGWPDAQPLLCFALSDKVGTEIVAHTGEGLRSTQMYCHDPDDPLSVEQVQSLPTVPSTTWDYLDRIWGPFTNAILWMDIERSELKALQGARNLLARGAILLINVEEMSSHGGPEPYIGPFLAEYGFRRVHQWNASEHCRDRIYIRG